MRKALQAVFFAFTAALASDPDLTETWKLIQQKVTQSEIPSPSPVFPTVRCTPPEGR